MNSVGENITGIDPYFSDTETDTSNTFIWVPRVISLYSHKPEPFQRKFLLLSGTQPLLLLLQHLSSVSTSAGRKNLGGYLNNHIPYRNNLPLFESTAVKAGISAIPSPLNSSSISASFVGNRENSRTEMAF